MFNVSRSAPSLYASAEAFLSLPAGMEFPGRCVLFFRRFDECDAGNSSRAFTGQAFQQDGLGSRQFWPTFILRPLLQIYFAGIIGRGDAYGLAVAQDRDDFERFVVFHGETVSKCPRSGSSPFGLTSGAGFQLRTNMVDKGKVRDDPHDCTPDAAFTGSVPCRYGRSGPGIGSNRFEVADQQTGKRASSCADQSTFSAICDTADDGAGCRAHGDVSFGRCAAGLRAATAVTAIMSFRIF